MFIQSSNTPSSAGANKMGGWMSNNVGQRSQSLLPRWTLASSFQQSGLYHRWLAAHKVGNTTRMRNAMPILMVLTITVPIVTRPCIPLFDLSGDGQKPHGHSGVFVSTLLSEMSFASRLSQCDQWGWSEVSAQDVGCLLSLYVSVRPSTLAPC